MAKATNLAGLRRGGCQRRPVPLALSTFRTTGPPQLVIEEASPRNERPLPASEETSMSSKDPDKSEQKPVPDIPQRLSDLPPNVVSDEEGKFVKGGPHGPSWQKPLT